MKSAMTISGSDYIAIETAFDALQSLPMDDQAKHELSQVLRDFACRVKLSSPFISDPLDDKFRQLTGVNRNNPKVRLYSISPWNSFP